MFETAKAHADEVAPAPVDTPVAAALTAFGFGLAVIAVFFAIRWLGAPEWAAWIGAAAIYALVAYGDSALGWARHWRTYRDALADLKGDRPGPSLH